MTATTVNPKTSRSSKKAHSMSARHSSDGHMVYPAHKPPQHAYVREHRPLLRRSQPRVRP